MFTNALATGEVFDQEYECSSPDQRRLFHVRALPIGDQGLLIEHSLVAEGKHDWSAREAVEAVYLGARGLLLQCSHCRRVRVPETHAWDWVREWAARPHPRTSHVICPSCVGFYWGRRGSRKGAS